MKQYAYPTPHTRNNYLLLPALVLLMTVLIAPAAMASTCSVYAPLQQAPNAQINAWIPDSIPCLRGMVMTTSSGKAQDLHACATALGFGLFSVNLNAPGMPLHLDLATTAQLQHILDLLAEKSKHPEISNAPLASLGFSYGGSNSIRLMTLMHTRYIAYGCLRSRAPLPKDLEALAVPGIWTVGSEDNAVWPGAVEFSPYYQDWRAANGQVAFMVNWGGIHNPTTEPATAEFEASWFLISEAMRLRYPGGFPSKLPGNPLLMKDLDTTKGWLGDAVIWDADIAHKLTPLKNISPFTPIASAADYTGDAKVASYLLDADMAFVYRAMNSVDDRKLVSERLKTANWLPPFNTPLLITAPSALAVYNVGDTVPVTIDPRTFITDPKTNSIKKIALYDGATLLDSADKAHDDGLWHFSYTPMRDGILALVAIATDANDKQTSTFRCIVVNPLAPIITQQPKDLTVSAGIKDIFNVKATGTSLCYQWRKNGQDIAGATNESYLSVFNAADNGAVYSVVVRNIRGSVTSADAKLRVVMPEPIPVLMTPGIVSKTEAK